MSYTPAVQATRTDADCTKLTIKDVSTPRSNGGQLVIIYNGLPPGNEITRGTIATGSDTIDLVIPATSVELIVEIADVGGSGEFKYNNLCADNIVSQNLPAV